MTDYSNGIVYKLCCNDPAITDIYVGSTLNMKSRKYEHKSRCGNPKDKKYSQRVYEFIRSRGGWANWDMVLITKVNAASKHELHREERRYIEELGATLNVTVPTRTVEEYHKTELRKIQKKKWNIDNRERKQAKAKEPCVCECGLIITRGGKWAHLRTKLHARVMASRASIN